MTFLESDHLRLCDLLERRRTVYSVTGSACDEIQAIYSGYKWFQSKTLHFVPPSQACTNPSVTLVQRYLPPHVARSVVCAVINIIMQIHDLHSAYRAGNDLPSSSRHIAAHEGERTT